MVAPLISIQFKNIKETEMIPFQRMIFFYLIGRFTQFEVDDELQKNPNTMMVVNCIAEQSQNEGMIFRFSGIKIDYIFNCYNFLPKFISEKLRPVSINKSETEMSVYINKVDLDRRPYNATAITFFDTK